MAVLQPLQRFDGAGYLVDTVDTTHLPQRVHQLVARQRFVIRDQGLQHHGCEAPPRVAGTQKPTRVPWPAVLDRWSPLAGPNVLCSRW